MIMNKTYYAINQNYAHLISITPEHSIGVWRLYDIHSSHNIPEHICNSSPTIDDATLAALTTEQHLLYQGNVPEPEQMEYPIEFVEISEDGSDASDSAEE